MSNTAVIEKTKQKVLLKSPAKINLFLEITGKRSDGYHNLVTVMQAIDLCDNISIEFSRTTKVVNLSKNGSIDLINKTLKEIELYTNQRFKVTVKVQKNIPMGTGLGSGASNAASIIKGIDELYNLNLTNTDKKRLATLVGSDVTFFLQSSTAVCKGKGDLVNDFKSNPDFQYLVIVPEERLLTKDVYAKLTREQLMSKKSHEPIVEYMKKGDAKSIRKNTFNRLWLPAVEIFPDLNRIKGLAEKSGLDGIQMTGSGSALYFVYRDEDISQKAKEFQNNLKTAKIKCEIFRCKGLS